MSGCLGGIGLKGINSGRLFGVLSEYKIQIVNNRRGQVRVWGGWSVCDLTFKILPFFTTDKISD